MLDFLLIEKAKSEEQPFLKKDSKWQSVKLPGSYILFINCNKIYKTSILDLQLILIGDFWGIETIQNNLNDIFQINKNIKGNYYGFLFSDNSIKVFSNLFNLLPVYFSEKYNFCSNNFEIIKMLGLSGLNIDKRFILESILFNYPFFDSTIYKEIKLLKTHHHLEFTADNISQHKHFNIENLFVKQPLKGSNVYSRLVDLFLERVKDYFPDQKSAITFTGGFDGRTLVSCASYFKKDFYTLSFGRESNDDVSIPKNNAEELNIKYNHIDASEKNYLEYQYLKCSEEMSLISGGYNGFLYPHFLYISKIAADDSEHLITGYCGSELFRSFNLTGALTSELLYDLFTIKNKKTFKERVLKHKNLEILNLNEFSSELESLINDLITYKENIPAQLTVNQRYYKFVFEEIFRKTFGFWITSQMRYINVRVPFLDYDFLNEFLMCDLAGINGPFFTNNPLKRFQGQFFYAMVIKKTNNLIYRQKTGKGYRPSDLIEPFGKINIAFPFFKKRFVRNIQKQDIDNLGIVSGLLYNKDLLTEWIHHSVYFTHTQMKNIMDRFDPCMNETERDVLLNAFSIINIYRS